MRKANQPGQASQRNGSTIDLVPKSYDWKMRYTGTIREKSSTTFIAWGPDREQLRRASEQLLCTSLYASMSACSALSDLEAERANASFPIAELTHVLDGDAQLTALNARLSKIASSDAVLSSWKRDEQRGVPRTSTLRHAEVMHRLHRCAQLAEKHDLDAMESLQLKVRASSTGHTYMHFFHESCAPLTNSLTPPHIDPHASHVHPSCSLAALGSSSTTLSSFRASRASRAPIRSPSGYLPQSHTNGSVATLRLNCCMGAMWQACKRRHITSALSSMRSSFTLPTLARRSENDSFLSLSLSILSIPN